MSPFLENVEVVAPENLEFDFTKDVDDRCHSRLFIR
jgi:hypothetical protein